MKHLWKVILLGGAIMLGGCSNSVDDYKDGMPKADIKEYFNGPIKGWGIVQDWRGRVAERFDVAMVGKWEGNTGTLTEHFSYYDGKKQERVWTIKKLDDGHYVGKAADILDKADGSVAGNAINWQYTMDVPVGDSTYRLSFDDWMWQMHNGVLINRSYLKKFGFTVAELTLFMQRQKP